MKTAPTLHTERLILRSFTREDATDVKHLTSDPDVASTTDAMERPCEDETAEEWIQWCHKEFEKGIIGNFAITLRTDGTLIGTVGLVFRIHLPYNDASLGYWIGKPYWNCGYATEAAKAMVAYGFREHDLDLIYADYSKRNPASGRVMQKIGMHYAYDLSEEDMIRYKIEKSEFVEE
ncbi:GNAT family N-acetyltransferase [Candidatus Poribacteria bacterium]|nr:GNAT family N-acetyltransferase [Candidatus Poribacteria bacterium]